MKRRSRLDAEGKMLWVVSPEDLVLFKLLANRPRDWGDITDILYIQCSMDDTYMRHWAHELGVAARLAKALSERSGDR